MQLSGWMEKIREQEWYQQIQGSYQQLPAEQQTYVKWGVFGGGAILWIFLVVSLAGSAGSMRKEYHEKQDLVRWVSDASEELRKLRGQSSSLSGGSAAQSWNSILGGLISGQGLPAESLEITKESAGASENVIQETLLEFQIKSVSIRPLVQILTQIQQGSPPMKLKGLTVEAGSSEGLLNATLNVSGYLAKGEKSK